MKLDDDRTRKATICNRLIKDLGCAPIDHPVDAETYAKTLIEQVILNGEDYDPAQAAVAAARRVEKIKATMPELYAGIEVEYDHGSDRVGLSVSKPKRTGGKDGGDKKAAAHKIFIANKGKPAGDIAKLIAAELSITYANAYYYVSRVFK